MSCHAIQVTDKTTTLHMKLKFFFENHRFSYHDVCHETEVILLERHGLYTLRSQDYCVATVTSSLKKNPICPPGVALEEKLGDHQSWFNLSSGHHECPSL